MYTFYKTCVFLFLFFAICLLYWYLFTSIVSVYLLQSAARYICWMDYKALRKKWFREEKSVREDKIYQVYKELLRLCVFDEDRMTMSNGLADYIKYSSWNPFLIVNIIGYWYYVKQQNHVLVHSYQNLCELDMDLIQEFVKTAFPDVYNFDLIRRDFDLNALVVKVIVNYDPIADLTYAADEVVFYDLDHHDVIQTVLSVGCENMQNYKKWLFAHGCTKYLSENLYL